MSNPNRDIYALGIGHNTPVCMDLAEACGYRVAAMYHYREGRTGETDHGVEIIGSFDDLFALGDLSGMNFLLTMGDMHIRSQVAEKLRSLGGTVPTLIHPTAVVSRFATIHPEAVHIGPFSHIQADTIIGRGTIVLSGVNISHTCRVGQHCFFAGGATLGAYTRMDDFAFMGQGALGISGKVHCIGRGAVVGAGSLLTRDVPPDATVAGRPARIIN